jgi:membrane glycosyltransferase
MKNIRKVIILLVLIIVLAVVAHPISMSNQYVGIAVASIILIIIGVIFSNISALFVSEISKFFLKLFRKK